eukprot:SAG31_NODE_1959_length_6808_cov_2.925771_6_plen_390_part_00
MHVSDNPARRRPKQIKRKVHDLAAEVIHNEKVRFAIAGFVQAANIGSFVLAAKTCWLAAREWPQYKVWVRKGPVVRHVRLNWVGMHEHERQRDNESRLWKSVKSLQAAKKLSQMRKDKATQQLGAIMRYTAAAHDDKASAGLPAAAGPGATAAAAVATSGSSAQVGHPHRFIHTTEPEEHVLLLLQAERRLAIAKINHLRLAERCPLKHLRCEDIAELAAVRSLNPFREATAASAANDLFMIRQLPFQRLSREILEEFTRNDFNFQSSAVLTLQDAAEAYMKECFSVAAGVSVRRNDQHEKVTPADLQAGKRIVDEAAAVRARKEAVATSSFIPDDINYIGDHHNADDGGDSDWDPDDYESCDNDYSSSDSDEEHSENLRMTIKMRNAA